MQLWSLPLLRGGDLDVASPVGDSEWRLGVEVRAAEEYDIHGIVVGGYLDDPPEPLFPLALGWPIDSYAGPKA